MQNNHREDYVVNVSLLVVTLFLGAAGHARGYFGHRAKGQRLERRFRLFYFIWVPISSRRIKTQSRNSYNVETISMLEMSKYCRFKITFFVRSGTSWVVEYMCFFGSARSSNEVLLGDNKNSEFQLRTASCVLIAVLHDTIENGSRLAR
ncbi:unnamed protein product [Nesidiocoris tenuis]|uniref:Uncharacterized protein n=1 Tax=Nesidiocoris tenuis TaxID=355587 RepID=A0A6H5HHJ9_9HEMI|nr:unnamed protein product [Nesidiocoris tenuis]